MGSGAVVLVWSHLPWYAHAINISTRPRTEGPPPERPCGAHLLVLEPRLPDARPAGDELPGRGCRAPEGCRKNGQKKRHRKRGATRGLPR
ncbi:hypothetical protein PIB30_114535, partial [Stylosanthes scabra]|nr:hypothetical protein [Stylosanthes scabra]